MRPVPHPLAVAVVAPEGRDGALAASALSAPVVPVADAAGLAEAVGRPDIGAVVVTAEGLAQAGVEAALRVAPPPAPELPVVAFVDDTRPEVVRAALAERLGPGVHLTVLARPVSVGVFRSVVGLALRERRQQLRVQALLGELAGYNERLEATVAAQTAELRGRADEVRALAQALTEAEDAERERLAAILHDDLQQVLVGVKMHVSLLDGQDDPDGLPAQIAGFVDEAIAQTRDLSADLGTPIPIGEGLDRALASVADDARARYGLRVEVDVTDGAVPSLTARALLTRAARELVLNAVKHAGVGRVFVRAWCDDGQCRLEVRDRGAGTGGAPEGNGLATLRRRVALVDGDLTVRSAPGEGTVVRISVPADA